VCGRTAAPRRTNRALNKKDEEEREATFMAGIVIVVVKVCSEFFDFVRRS